MAIQPISVSRVSTTLATSSLLASLRRNTLNIYSEQNRISSGRQYLSASENPGKAARALNLSEIADQQTQMLTNILHASNTLDATDAAMAEASGLVIDAQAIASQNIGSLSSADERIAAAEVVASIREQLVVVGNRTFEGRYLFAGRRTDQQPFVSALGGVAYMGDTSDVFARTDVNELEPINLSGDKLFGALSSQVASAVDLNPIITEGTRLEDLRGSLNQGVRRGTFEIVEDGAGGAVTINMTSADTIGDVVATINAAAEAAGAGFTAALTTNGISITPGGPTITIRDISTGTTAGDLGITTPEATGGIVTGADLGVAVTRTTRIADLAGGAGLDLTGGMVITNGLATAEIDLAAAETVQDILNTINNAGVYARADINAAGTGINVVNAVSGTTMTIGENGGAAATALGIRSMFADTPVNGLNNGLGLRTVEGKDDIRIVSKTGDSFPVNLDGATSIGDVITAINAAAAEAGVAVTADLAEVGNGIRLVDATGGTGNLQVTRENNSFAGDDLGLLKTTVDPATELIGDDVHGARANGLLSSMLDLELALRDNDSQAITLASESLDIHLVDFNRSRGIVGAQAAAMQDRLIQTDSAVFATQALLSEVQDLDFTEAITKFQQAQTALQASLMTGSQILNTSLLDYLA